MEIKLPGDFKEFLKLLKKHEVKYVLIGGYAVGYYGYPRATNDMDIFISNKKDNINKIIKVLIEFGFNKNQISENLFEEGNIIRIGNPPIRIELLTKISGIDFKSCYNNRNLENIDSIPVNIISLIDLKRNKKASGRHKDLDDVENLP